MVHLKKTLHIFTNTQLNTENVTLLSYLFHKKDNQLLPFAANQTAILPQWLQDEKKRNNSSVVSYKELVLERIQQDKQNILLKRKKIAKGAEIITQKIKKIKIKKKSSWRNMRENYKSLKHTKKVCPVLRKPVTHL